MLTDCCCCIPLKTAAHLIGILSIIGLIAGVINITYWAILPSYNLYNMSMYIGLCCEIFAASAYLYHC